MSPPPLPPPPSSRPPPPQTPLSAMTPAKSREVSIREQRDLIAANALVKLATANAMNNNNNNNNDNKVSTPPAMSTDSSSARSAAEQPSTRTDDTANHPGNVAERRARELTITLGSTKRVEGNELEESVESGKDGSRDPRELMAAKALVGLATSGTVDGNKMSTPAMGTSSVNEIRDAKTSERVDNIGDKKDEPPVKARNDAPGEPRKLIAAKDHVQPATKGIARSNETSKLATEAASQSKYIALTPRKGEYKISDHALRLLEEGGKRFVRNLLTDKRKGTDNPIKKAQQRILAEKREADRRKKQQAYIKEDLPAMLKRLKDAIEKRKEPNESEELRLMREAMIRATVSMYKDMFKTTTDLKDAVRRLEREIASHEDLFGPGGDLETDYVFFVYGPLGKDEGTQTEAAVETQQWVLLEDSGWDRRTRRRLAGEARLTPEIALREGASVLEFTFGPTVDVEKTVDGDGDTETICEGPGSAAAASEAVDSAKLEGSSANAHHTATEKLDPRANRATSTDTTNGGIASALSGIDVSKVGKPSNTAPKKPQDQPPPEAKTRSVNPFYRPDMTLAIAAQNIVAYFREAADWLNFWHISTSASTLVDMSLKTTSTLSRIFWHLRWTAEFLRLGRAGWDLRCLPDNFFEDVLPLIMVTCGKLEKLGELKGCGDMMIRAWKDAEEVGEMLATVWNVRARDGKEAMREGRFWDKVFVNRGWMVDSSVA